MEWGGSGGGGQGAGGGPFTTRLLRAQDEGNLNIVMEFASRGNVEEAIKRRQATRFPFAELTVLSWMRQLGGALQHMHSMQILHRDLKVCMPQRLRPHVQEAAALCIREAAALGVRGWLPVPHPAPHPQGGQRLPRRGHAGRWHVGRWLGQAG